MVHNGGEAIVMANAEHVIEGTEVEGGGATAAHQLVRHVRLRRLLIHKIAPNLQRLCVKQYQSYNLFISIYISRYIIW